ncbi:MAG: TetR family transcriptional regulator [Haliea sp.]|nr:MAG: TetR family transcriptional regulator [Haliea sp.]
MAKIKRLLPDDRKEQLLNVALKLAEKDGLAGLQRAAIAEAAGVSVGLVTWRFGTMVKCRREVMRAAIQRRVMRIIAEGVATRDPQALKAPPALRFEAMGAVAGQR